MMTRLNRFIAHIVDLIEQPLLQISHYISRSIRYLMYRESEVCRSCARRFAFCKVSGAIRNCTWHMTDWPCFQRGSSPNRLRMRETASTCPILKRSSKALRLTPERHICAKVLRSCGLRSKIVLYFFFTASLYTMDR